MLSGNEMDGKVRLFLFDFDHTLVDGNSDLVVFEHLEPDLVSELMSLSKEVGWTSAVDGCLGMLAARGYTIENIRDAVARLAMGENLVNELKSLKDHGDVVILSDANSEFIDAVLMRHGLKYSFHHIITNPARREGGRLRVSPCQDPPAGCASCPSNLCKGSVVSGAWTFGNLRRTCFCGQRAGK